MSLVTKIVVAGGWLIYSSYIRESLPNRNILKDVSIVELKIANGSLGESERHEIIKSLFYRRLFPISEEAYQEINKEGINNCLV